MYTQSELENIVANSLNTYCFQNIWNETQSEFRVNIIPEIVNKNSSAGNVFYKNKPISLPTQKDNYYVFAISSNSSYGINNKPLERKWYSLVDLCNEEDILVDVYHLNGKMFHKGYTYLYPLEDKSGYLLAINKVMANTIVPYNKMLVKNQVVNKDNFTTMDTFLNPDIEEEAVYLREEQSLDNLPSGFYIHDAGTIVTSEKGIPFTNDKQYNFIVALDKTQFAVTYSNGTSTAVTRKLQLVNVIDPETNESKYEKQYSPWVEYYNKIQIGDDGVEYYSYLPMIRVSIYYDSDIVNKITIKSHKISLLDPNGTSKDEFLKFIQLCNANFKHITIYKDGYETHLKNSSIFTQDSYIDIIHDENSLFTYDINISESTHNHVFFSDKDKKYKQLIHFPKELNPNNEIYTHNTMTIYVRDNTENRGVLLHRCADDSVSQITHNDIAIPTYILDAFRDHLDQQDISLHIVVRKHEKNNTLIRDKSYIDLLYSLDDTTIVQHLLGTIEPESLYFWKASELEKTKYLEMMFDVPNIITPSNMYDYVEGLGYYQTVSLICKRIHHSTITEWFKGFIYFTKPYIYQSSSIYPLVYINGNKVSNSKISINNDDPTSVGITLDKTVKYKLGDTVSVEMFLDGNNRIYTITPNEELSYVDLPYNNFTILEELYKELPISGINKEYSYSYTKFTDTTGNLVILNSPDIPNYTRVIFGPLTYGKTFIIQNNTRVFRYDLSTNINEDMVEGNPFIYSLQWGVYNSSKEVPIYNTSQVLVYLNGKYLIKDTDFTIVETRDYNDNLMDKQVIIQNLSYLKDSNNTLEIFVTSANVENTVSGFVVDNKAFNEEDLSLLFANMSTLHIDGMLEYNGINKGNYIEVPSSKYRNGAVFESCTAIPQLVKEFLDKYHKNDDIERLKVLNEYFYGNRPSYPSQIVIPYSHKVYSVFTAAIIHDILNGAKDISLDPDYERMIDQLSKYKGYRESDLVFNDKLDLRFIDTYPHYRNFEVDNIGDYEIINVIVSKLLPTDTDTGYELYYNKKEN